MIKSGILQKDGDDDKFDDDCYIFNFEYNNLIDKLGD